MIGALLSNTTSEHQRRETPLFDLKDVSLTVPGKSLLQPLTMTIPARRTIGLIGHNGSGKSTLLKVLARQKPASKGTVLFEGKFLSEWGDRPLHPGRLIARGTPPEIMTPGVLKEICGIDMAIMAHPQTGLPVGLPC
ncbi:ATP-binding cassette domain-containing protein [Neorhizobium galegae]|uniref:ATP-binding cassette domain-containing protein n=1 Tax=Neorhizobium galegae TaxID=399 RepID=UPI002103690C|nr:ATP-binding cassette domain-containing protein [Neorhizobium galegae]MCQ1776408.1 ATP-binding cassette domain-containing protein [Neorhizobium galegae]MCQ1798904.1 ATP-binding cassette domain-containing protein [Neorhizobium galegae]